MVLKLDYMEEKDIPAFAVVDERAFAGYAFARAMEPPGMRRRDMAEGFARQGFGKNKDEHWLKVTDTETGDFVAMALWKFHEEREISAEQEDESSKPAQEPAEDNNKVAAFFAALGVMWRRFEVDHIGTKPYLHLYILITDPQYQRRGAGGMLVRWGCDKADEQGLMTVLTASEAGAGLYLKHGFNIVKKEPFDLRPYDVDETIERKYMIRQPVAKDN